MPFDTVNAECDICSFRVSFPFSDAKVEISFRIWDFFVVIGYNRRLCTKSSIPNTAFCREVIFFESFQLPLCEATARKRRKNTWLGL